MTIHAAKGLEFKVVFVISLNMGVFPKVNFDNKSEYEEERRIAYVALTRAQERLYLTNASGFDVVNQKQLTDSLFLKEVQGKHLREVGKQMVTISDLQQD
jgi:DNA helicase-2/ATP-dependent DNA helicase PcrA